MTIEAMAEPGLTGKDVFGHPRGLGYLVFCEAFERFSYYGMQALLALYISQYLLLPEHAGAVAGLDALRRVLESIYGPLGTPLAFAGAVTGFYSAGVYFTPMIGGWIADQLLGRTMTVTIGSCLMVLGHFLMAFDVSFVAAILCLFVGVGCFKGNIASQVGELYGAEDLRRSSGYQIFFLGIQIAVIVAPLVTGFLGERVAWHYGFGAAGVGMAIALVVYLAGRKHLPPDHRKARAEAAAKGMPPDKLASRDWATMAVLVAMLPVLAAVSVGNQEIFNAYLLWGDAHYNLTVPVLPSWLPFSHDISGQTMPTTWLVSLDAIISTLTVAGALAFWTVWARYRKEPDEIVKIAIGALISAGAPLLLAAASAQEAATGQKASLIWGLGFHIVNDIGFAMVFPVGLALYSRAAPRQLAGLFIGIYYLHLFVCNLATGKLAGFLDTMSGQAFWTMHAVIITAGAAALLVSAFVFRKLLAPTAAEKEVAAVAAAA
jgi:POT family proton-dependent oligopeptide transporter